MTDKYHSLTNFCSQGQCRVCDRRRKLLVGVNKETARAMAGYYSIYYSLPGGGLGCQPSSRVRWRNEPLRVVDAKQYYVSRDAMEQWRDDNG